MIKILMQYEGNIPQVGDIGTAIESSINFAAGRLSSVHGTFHRYTLSDDESASVVVKTIQKICEERLRADGFPAYGLIVDAHFPLPAKDKALFDLVVTVQSTEALAGAPTLLEEEIAQFLTGRIRVTMRELLSDCLKMEASKWTSSEQRRIGKALKNLGWIRQRQREGGQEWFYAAPGYADPSDGEGRFRQCAVCTGYYGRPLYGQFTPCPCGECEPADQYPPLLPEKSQTHDLASHLPRTAPSQALALTTANHSPIAMPPDDPAISTSPGASAQDTHQMQCRLGRQSETDRPRASPRVESERIAHSGPTSGKPAAGDMAAAPDSPLAV